MCQTSDMRDRSTLPHISFVINETHYFDNGEELLIDPMNNFLISGAFRYRNRIAYTSLIKGFKLETVAGTIKLNFKIFSSLNEPLTPIHRIIIFR